MSARYYAKLAADRRPASLKLPGETTPPPSDVATTTLAGIVLAIWGQQESGWCAVKLREGDKTKMLVGVTPPLSPGDFVEAHGHYTQHEKYGWQFKADLVVVKLPADAAAITAWLAARLPWIGPARSEALLDRFGVALWAVLDREPEQLLEIPGITAERLAEIIAAVAATRSERDSETGLIGLGLTAREAAKVSRAFGAQALDRVCHNPYELYWAIGLPVATVERVAEQVGIAGDAPKRIEFLADVLLERATNEGHCYAMVHALAVDIAQTYGRVGIDQAKVVLQAPGRFHLEDGAKRIYLPRLYAAEVDVASKCRDRSSIDFQWGPLARVDAVGATEDQQRALDLMVTGEPVVVVTGYPGTGKTWTIKAAVDALEARGARVALCAPTGKAARRITEATGREAETVHRLLEYGREGFARNEYNPIDEDVVVVDESSMLDVELAAHLVAALRSTPLVLVGDANQLPPVGPGAVLRDIIASKVVPTVFLRELKRAQADTWVYRNAPHILEHGTCELDHDGDDFLFYEMAPDSASLLGSTVVDVVRKLIDEGATLNDFQVLSPMKERIGGTYPLNEALQRDLNERLGTKPVIERRVTAERNQVFCEGDRVMQTRNNYDMWIMNGEIGVVVDVNLDGTAAQIKFDDGTRVYEGADLDDLQLAYAITCHKFQGSETNTAIVVCHSAHNHMLTRQLFYTAVTRAKRRVILVGDEAGVRRALATKRDEYRRTRLVEKIQEGIAR